LESTPSIPDDAAPAEAAPEKPKAPAGKRFARLAATLDTPLKKTVAVATGIAAIAGGITGVLRLRDELFPAPKPVTAVITPSDAVEPDVPWRVGSKHHPELASRTFTPSQEGALGIVLTVRMEITGQKDKTGRLRWRRVTQDGETLELPAWAPAEVPVRPDFDKDDLRRQVWVLFPVAAEAFVVEFSYLDHRGRPRGSPAPSRLFRIG
jgi:hypothetical protein